MQTLAKPLNARLHKTKPVIITGGLFLAAFGLAEFFINRSFLIIAFYCVASLVTFFVYTVDKHAARKGLWRIPETHLHLLALIGGVAGRDTRAAEASP